MKLPLWAKTKEDKWEVFPYHYLETLDDGRQGFRFRMNYPSMGKTAAFVKFRDCFEPNPVGWEQSKVNHPMKFDYPLKEDK
jgi:hypothetical protein